MQCPRCGGNMAREEVYTNQGKLVSWKCLQCGRSPGGNPVKERSRNRSGYAVWMLSGSR